MANHQEELLAGVLAALERLVARMDASLLSGAPSELMDERVVVWQTTDHHMHGRLVGATRDYLKLKVDRNGEDGTERVPEDRDMFLPVTAVMLLHREEDEEAQYEEARKLFGEHS